MVNVTKANFIEQSNDLIANLPSAVFVAIDEEMTGINLPGSGRPRKDRSPGDRYEELKQVPERYSIIQLGISLFHTTPEDEDEDGEIRIDRDDDEDQKRYRVRRYNFYTFPDKDSSREVVMSPSAADFLNRFNMSYDQWVKQGVTHTSVDTALDRLEGYMKQRIRKDEEAKIPPQAPTIQDAARRVEIRRPEDVEFFSRCMANLREWLDSPLPRRDPVASEGTCFLLPACNSFMRRAFYESIGREYPALVLENAGPEHPNQIRVWRLNEEEKKRRDARLRREEWEATVCNSVGLTRVFLALSNACRGLQCDRTSALFAQSIDHVDWTLPAATTKNAAFPRKIPLIVHNGFMDLTFLMTHFVTNTLPPTLPECKELLRDYFPIVYDTKILATEHSMRYHGENTNLGNLYAKIGTIGELTSRIENVALSSTAPPDQEHEAAYDAYMTGVCYIGLCDDIRAAYGLDALTSDNHDGVAYRTCMGRNRLYQMSMYSLDLENLEGDPLSRGMSPESMYRVSGIDPAVSTKDIIRCLNNLTDENNRGVQFEIIWVDDTTFLAGANFRDGLLGMGQTVVEQDVGRETMRRHGDIIESALIRRFSRESVQSLSSYLDSLKTASQGESDNKSLFSFVARLLGFGKRKLVEDDEEASPPSAKRRRLN